jgi:hypothetical protein
MSRAKLLMGALATVVLFCTAAESSAQSGVRRGFWIEAARGTGTVRNTCGGCDELIVGYGSADFLRVGGSLSDRFLLGVEIFAMNTSDLVLAPGATPVEAENGSVIPIAIWYVGQSGFFLKGGAGLARGTFSVRTEDAGTVTTERTGSALTYGLGFDIGIARWFAITANVGSNVMAIGDVRVNGTVVDDVIATVYEASVGIALR